MADQNLEGVPLRLGGRDYILPPLNLAALEKYWPMIEAWGKGEPVNPLQRLLEGAEILHTALSRNYPDLTLAEVKEALDLINFKPVLDRILDVSGLVSKPPGEQLAGSAPTGASSVPGSPASPAGPGSTSASG